jgi:hypothetical protein
MRHKTRSVALLSMLVMLVIGVSASVANAAISFEWKVKGAALKTGASKEVNLVSKGTFHVKHTKIASYGIERTFASTKLKLAHGKILGGKPGKIEGTLELENTVLEKPKGEGCEIASPTMVIGPLVGEIVENSEAGIGRGKTEIVFKLAGGEEALFTKYGLIQREGSEFPCESRGDEYYFYGGSFVVEVSPQLTEAKAIQLPFTSVFSKEYVNSAKEVKASAPGRYWFGSLALTGEPELELVSKELFEPF